LKEKIDHAEELLFSLFGFYYGERIGDEGGVLFSIQMRKLETAS